MRRLAVDAVGTFDRGGAVLLGAFLDEVARFPDVAITVYCSPGLALRRHHARITYHHVDADGAAAKLRWALRGWKRASRDFELRFSFNGFSIAPDQAVFVHNALYYDLEARASLSAGAQLKLQVLKELTDEALRDARIAFVQNAWMASQVGRPVEIVHPIVEPATPSPAPAFSGPGPHILNVGSDLAYKDNQTFWSAVQAIRGHSHLVGNFADHASSPGRTFHGSLSREAVFAAYRDADALVVTSRCESMGLPIVEAMQSGLPIVAVDLPYARELCGPAAFYFTAGDAEACASSLRKALSADRAVVEDAGEARLRELRAERGLRRMATLIL